MWPTKGVYPKGSCRESKVKKTLWFNVPSLRLILVTHACWGKGGSECESLLILSLQTGNNLLLTLLCHCRLSCLLHCQHWLAVFPTTLPRSDLTLMKEEVLGWSSPAYGDFVLNNINHVWPLTLTQQGLNETGRQHELDYYFCPLSLFKLLISPAPTWNLIFR